MLSPEQVVPFLQHADPIVLEHAHRYFVETVDFGPLTADHYWAVIDRLGENDASLGFAAELQRVPQTDESLRRLIKSFASSASEPFEFHYQHAARDMQLDVLARHRAELLAVPQLLPHVREHLELRLRLLDESPVVAWDRLMQRGRELGGAYAYSFNASLSDALVEAAGRGGADVCAKAMAMMDDESAGDDWRDIFAVRVLGEARYEPAIDALVEKFAIDTDVLREVVTTALSRIGTPRVIERIVAFFPYKPWHVRLYAHSPLVRIKRPDSETALLQLLEMESSLEEEVEDDEGGSLADSMLLDLTVLGSLAALEQSRELIADFPDDPEANDLCECLLATAIMNGVTLPEEAEYRKRIKLLYRRVAAGRADLGSKWGSRIRESWRQTGVSCPPAEEKPADPEWDVVPRRVPSAPYYPSDRIEPIRNTSPKVGRNDPCPCGSGKKYKKCCGK